jgi:hypothetical protein
LIEEKVAREERERREAILSFDLENEKQFKCPACEKRYGNHTGLLRVTYSTISISISNRRAINILLST